MKRFLRTPWPALAALIVLILLFAPSPQALHVAELVEYARLEAEAGDAAAAFHALEEAIALAPDQHELCLPAAELAFQAGLLDEASELIDAFLQHTPEDNAARCLLGHIQLEQGQLVDARGNLSPQCTGYITDLQRLALAFAASGQPERAIDAAQELLQLAPGDPAALEQAALHQAAYAPDEALPLLRATLQDPDSSHGLLPALIRAIEDARISDDPAAAAASVGQVFVRFQLWPLARTALQVAVDVDPAFSAAHAYLGFVLGRLGEDGSDSLQRAYELEPDSLIAVMFLTDDLIQRQQASDALPLLEQLLASQPDNPVIFAQIGAASAASGDFPTAKSAYLQAVELAPDEATFWLALAQFSLQYEVELAELGLPAARNALVLAPGDATALDTLGYAHLLLGNTDMATRFLAEALAASPEQAEIWLHQALLLQRQGDIEGARRALETAAALDPFGSIGQRAARMLENISPE